MKTAPPTEQRWEQREKRTERWRSLAVVVVSMAVFLDTVDVSIVNVALPTIALFLRAGTTGDYVGIILPSTLLAMLGMAMCVPSLAVAAVSGIEPTEQGLAAGLQGTFLQAGGGLGLAITAVVVTIATISARGFAQTPAPSVTAQLHGLHIGLFVPVAGAALGMLIATAFIQKQSALS